VVSPSTADATASDVTPTAAASTTNSNRRVPIDRSKRSPPQRGPKKEKSTVETSTAIAELTQSTDAALASATSPSAPVESSSSSAASSQQRKLRQPNPNNRRNQPRPQH